jgi:D-amino-acid dehydrogenase
MTNKRKVAVIGAGITGVTAAYQLVNRGYDVTVFEKELYPGMGTSYANGSQLSVCNSQTWTTWSMVVKGLKWMFKKDAPFYISPSMDLEKIKWLLNFLRVTVSNQADANTIKTIKLALESRAETLRIAEVENIQFDHVSKGILHIYTDQKSFQKATSYEAFMKLNGCDWSPVTHQQCLDIEPTLSNSNLVGGIYTKDDSTGDLHKFVKELSKVLQNKYQVEFLYNTEVKDINVSDNGAVINRDYLFDDIVIASGPSAQKWSKKLGDDLGVYPIKGYSITVDLADKKSQSSAPWTSLLDDDAKIVCSRLGDDRLRVAGTAELAGYNLDICHHRIKPLLDWTHKWFPGVNTSSYRPWAGLRPMSYDMLPRVKQGKNQRIWYCGSAGHLGWTLGAGMSIQLANLMSSQQD